MISRVCQIDPHRVCWDMCCIRCLHVKDAQLHDSDRVGPRPLADSLDGTFDTVLDRDSDSSPTQVWSPGQLEEPCVAEPLQEPD